MPLQPVTTPHLCLDPIQGAWLHLEEGKDYQFSCGDRQDIYPEWVGINETQGGAVD